MNAQYLINQFYSFPLLSMKTLLANNFRSTHYPHYFNDCACNNLENKHRITLINLSYFY